MTTHSLYVFIIIYIHIYIYISCYAKKLGIQFVHMHKKMYNNITEQFSEKTEGSTFISVK